MYGTVVPTSVFLNLCIYVDHRNDTPCGVENCGWDARMEVELGVAKKCGSPLASSCIVKLDDWRG